MDAESKLNLEQDTDAVAAFVGGNGGVLYSELTLPGVFWINLGPLANPAERFYLRLHWTSYPFAAASMKFGSTVGGRLDDPQAWPNMPGYRNGSFDICKPISAEGYALHQEWAAGPHAWQSSGNPFLYVAQTVQNDFDTHFAGRHG